MKLIAFLIALLAQSHLLTAQLLMGWIHGPGPATNHANLATDIDNDGLEDIVYCHTENPPNEDQYSAIKFQLNKNGRVLPTRTIGRVRGQLRALIAADFDNDGLIDIAAGSTAPNGQIKILWNIGRRGWTGSPWRETSIDQIGNRGAHGLTAYDINHDGRLELISAQRRAGKVAWYDLSDGGAEYHEIPHSFTGAMSVACGNLDEDSDPELVISTENGLFLSHWTDNGFDNLTPLLPGANGRHVLLSDLDRDQRLDVLTTIRDETIPPQPTKFTSTVTWLRNEGNLKFERHDLANYPESHHSYFRWLQLGDFNDDGRQDVAASMWGGPFHLLFNEGGNQYSEHMINHSGHLSFCRWHFKGRDVIFPARRPNMGVLPSDEEDWWPFIYSYRIQFSPNMKWWTETYRTEDGANLGPFGFGGDDSRLQFTLETPPKAKTLYLRLGFYHSLSPIYLNP